MYNPHAFACERNKSSRIRKQEVGFRLSEAVGSFRLFSLEEKEKEKMRKRETERKREEKEKEKERKLSCGAHPEQKNSTIGANLHLPWAPPLHTCYF